MLKKKKGLSNIIATVLIVLLALAAIAIIWGFLRTPLERSGESVDLQTECFTVEVEPTGSDTCIAGIFNVNVQLNKGAPYEVIAIVTDAAGTSASGQEAAPGTLLSSVPVSVDASGLALPVTGWKIEAAAVVGDSVTSAACDKAAVEIICP
jgi:hypothetical protein